MEGFEEGKDYLVLKETDFYVAYQPFTWEASRMIASHYVEPSRNEEGNLDDADWCTAYQKDRDYWDNHNEIEAFIYICGEDIPSKKVAISISKEEYDASDSEFLYSIGRLNFNIWDFYDENDTIEEEELLEVVPNLYTLIKKAYGIWKDKKEEKLLSKLKLNPQTNKYDCDGDLNKDDLNIIVSEDKDGFTINFGKITGDFDCSSLGLKSLKGAPQTVGGSFKCWGNKLTSLKGAPQKVGGRFNCSNNRLTFLEGAPQEVGGDFICHNNQLTSLEGVPQEIGGDFSCSDNQLTSLKGAPQEVGGHFSCRSNQLTSLEGAPHTVGGGFNCSINQLTSLEGAPQRVGGYFNCFRNQLISLKGAPKEVGEYFSCSRNQLTSLKGAPQKVGGDFSCYENHLTSLEGAPQTVGGGFYCYDNPNLHSLDYIGEVKGRIYKDF